jgi:hypothetical protein
MVQAPRDLADVVRHGGSIRAECRSCFRVALFAPGELGAHFARKKWDSSWPQFARRLRCQCGARGPKVSWLVTEPPPSDPPPPKPRFVRNGGEVPWKPAGIDQSEWDRAVDDRERRRLVRQARG